MVGNMTETTLKAEEKFLKSSQEQPDKLHNTNGCYCAFSTNSVLDGTIISSLNPTNSPRYCCDPHFTDSETEVLSGRK